MLTTIAIVAACGLGAVGCTVIRESSTAEGPTGTAEPADKLEEADLDGLCSAPSVYQVCAARAHPQAAEAQTRSCEPIGEATEDLTKWQQTCTLGCAILAAAGCASVSTSCTAGAIWSFGGVLIPCAYAVVAACTGSASITTVCAIKCAGG